MRSCTNSKRPSPHAPAVIIERSSLSMQCSTTVLFWNEFPLAKQIRTLKMQESVYSLLQQVGTILEADMLAYASSANASNCVYDSSVVQLALPRLLSTFRSLSTFCSPHGRRPVVRGLKSSLSCDLSRSSAWSTQCIVNVSLSGSGEDRVRANCRWERIETINDQV